MSGAMWRYSRDVLVRQGLTGRHCGASTYVRLRNWGNRHFYSLLLFLSSADRPCVVGADRPWIIGPTTYLKGMDRYAQQAFSLPHVRFSHRPPDDVEQMVFIHDGGWPELERLPWQATIHVDYEISHPPPSDAPWRVLPLLMHPLIYSLGQEEGIAALRNGRRTIRLFFAGNFDEKLYASSSSTVAIRERLGVLDRPAVIRAITNEFGAQVRWLRSNAEWAQVLENGPDWGIAFAGEDGFRVPQSRWLETLSHCDVFLSPPGAFFPLCHNLVEAMAVGAIPLTNYPDWYDPPLEHLKNCFAFSSAEDLVEQTHRILAMSEQELATIREGVLRYHDRHFDRRAFPQRYLQDAVGRSRLFVVTDNAKRWEGMTRDSVLFARRSCESTV